MRRGILGRLRHSAVRSASADARSLWTSPSMLLVALVSLAFTGPHLAQAQRPSVMTLVPASNWRAVSSEKLDVRQVSRWGDDPAVDAEYGVKSAELRAYELDSVSGHETATVAIEEASDASAAYGLLTYYRTDKMGEVAGVHLTTAGPNLALMARGRVFLRFIVPEKSRVSADELRALLVVVGGAGTSSDRTADLPTPLPSAGLVPRTDKYLLGPEAARRMLPSLPADLIGFAQGAEVEVGHYATDSDHAASDKVSATVVAIAYPTFQIARDRFGLMEKTLGLNQDRGADSVYGKRSGSFIFLVLNEKSKAAATQVLDRFNVSAEVSGIPRYPGKKSVALQMLELIVANLLLVIALAGTAILGGVLIVLSKRAAQKWFPTSEWGSSESERLITLNLR